MDPLDLFFPMAGKNPIPESQTNKFEFLFKKSQAAATSPRSPHFLCVGLRVCACLRVQNFMRSSPMSLGKCPWRRAFLLTLSLSLWPPPVSAWTPAAVTPFGPSSSGARWSGSPCTGSTRPRSSVTWPARRRRRPNCELAGGAPLPPRVPGI